MVRSRRLPVTVLLSVLVTLLALAGAATPAAPAVRVAPASPSPSVSPAVSPASPASAGEKGATIRVGIKPLDPFVEREGQDRYRGFSVDLWNEIAQRNGWTTQYVWHDDLPGLLDDVRTGGVDAGIAGISITKEREEVLDFSYPMFNAGLQVMARPAGGSDWATELSGFVTAGVGRYLLALVVVLVLAGNVVWLVTWLGARRAGTSPQKYLPGVGLGMFKAAGVGLAGDFGVGDPVRPFARFMAITWAIIGVCFVSLFTAAVTTQLTVQSIRTDITGIKDLGGRHVVTVASSSAQRYLTDHQITFTTVPSIDQAYPLLHRAGDGQADAIIFDAPVLQHRVTVNPTADEVLVGGVFAHEDYGIAFSAGSRLRKKVNTTLLEMRSDGSYDRLYDYYFGNALTR